MTETQRKIREYQQMLPGLKERVMAVAVLLVVSMTMVVSASFAWITLSRAPEVSMLATTVASNGNLEIALVNKEGDVPNEVALGDSAAAPGRDLVSANITWGNLVNLSDSSYGLNQIDLRPALLSGYALNKTPLYGATYSADGRVKDVSATYQYASWTKAEDGTEYFAAGDAAKYGVRAISSVKYENISGNATITTMVNRAKTAYTNATTMYLNVINGTTMVDEVRGISCMDALTMLLTVFVNEKAESATVSGGDVYHDYSSVVTYSYRLLLEYRNILDAEGEALLLLANLQAYANNAELGTAYFKSAAELRAASDSTLTKLGVTLDSLKTYKSNYTDIEKAIAGMEPFAIAHDPDTGTSNEKVYWSNSVIENGETLTVNGIGQYMGSLVDINSTTCNGIAMNKVSINNATTVIAEPIKVVISKGVLMDTEQRLGNMMETQGTTVTIDISVKILGFTVGKKTATVRTAAKAPFLSNNDKERSDSMEATGGGEAVSLDTYGLAIDVWLRTNAEDAVLILEGNIVESEQDATCIDKNGNETALYEAKNADGAVEVYMLEEKNASGQTVINVYDRISHIVMGTQSELMTEDGGGYTFKQKKITVVTGYNGENRVWEDWQQMLENGLIDENSTTQGAGSCYVFYANPSEQTKILDMLKAFTIAFLDQAGNHIATAKLDTEHSYAINGKVTVPMYIVSGVTYLDEDGEEQLGIRNMPRNTPTWLTAVVYLDGMYLTNEHVLAAGEIEGRLNIQFGTVGKKDAMSNLELQQKYRTAEASATYGNTTSNDAQTPIEFEYDGKAKEITVSLKVEGDQPTNVSGFFIRSVGASQGTRTDSVDFKPEGGGVWTAKFSLTKPGSYSMRSVIMDGVEYVLDLTPTVNISGLSVTSVRCNPDSGRIMTAEPYVDVQVEAVVNAVPELMPKQVRALFRGEDGKEYTAIMSYDITNEVWTGTARIDASGTYTLTYLVMDGDYNELTKSDEPLQNQQKTLIITLGMKAVVSCTGIVDKDGNPVTENEFRFKNGPYTLSVNARIFDDRGNAITEQDDVVLYYWLDGGKTDQDGMYHQLEWDPVDKRYEGHMQMVNAGTYRFNRIAVQIDGEWNNIRKASDAPVFESTPPDPPRVDTRNNETAAYQFAPAGNAEMFVNMYYAQTADVYAVIRNVQNGQEKVVKSDPNTQKTMVGNPTDPADANYYRFGFTVPQTDEGTVYHGEKYQHVQDGDWVITEIWLQKVYDADTNYFPSTVEEGETPDREDCMVFDVYNENKPAEQNIYTYVVQSVRYNIIKGNNNKYTGENFNGVFMQSHTISGVSLEIYDWSGGVVPGIKDVTLKISHNGDVEAKGGYTTTRSYPETLWALSVNGITYAAADTTLQLAGTYRVHLSYSIETDAGLVERNFSDVMGYVVESAKPYAMITQITPSGAQPNKITYSTNFLGTPTFTAATISGTSSQISSDKYSATVYALAVADNSGSAGSLSNRNGSFTKPKVTITVYGLASGYTGTLTLPAGSSGTSAKTFTFDDGLESSATVELGATGQIKTFGAGSRHKLYAYYGHGTKTMDTLTITDGVYTYTVKLTNVLTITNPDSVNQG